MLPKERWVNQKHSYYPLITRAGSGSRQYIEEFILKAVSEPLPATKQEKEYSGDKYPVGDVRLRLRPLSKAASSLCAEITLANAYLSLANSRHTENASSSSATKRFANATSAILTLCNLLAHPSGGECDALCHTALVEGDPGYAENHTSVFVHCFSLLSHGLRGKSRGKCSFDWLSLSANMQVPGICRKASGSSL
jgi:hypothetical protein